MPLITWEDKYSIQIQEIDKQHKVWIGIINKLHGAMSEGRAAKIMGEILAELVEYTRTHFSTEETLMAQYGFSGFAAHRQIHADMVKKVADIQRQYQDGKLALSLEVMTFLRDWLLNHILTEDKKYAAFLREKGMN